MLGDFFRGAAGNFVRVFAPRYLVWHALAIVLTWFLVASGFDWWYFEHTRGLFSLTLPAAIAGFFVPVITPVVLYLLAEVRRNAHLRRSASALAQAGILGLFISSLYKAFTGRMQPEFMTHLSSVDISREFNFGFLNHGVFWGWPSSHTAVAFAMAAALVLLYPRQKLVRFFAPLYALYIGLGISVSIHWYSDFVAGAILGTLIGIVVAKSFKTQNT